MQPTLVIEAVSVEDGTIRDYVWQFEESREKSTKTDDELKDEKSQNPIQPSQDAEENGTRNEQGEVKKNDK